MMNSSQVWVVDDDASIRWVLRRTFTDAGLSVQQFSSADEALERVVVEQPKVILTDVRMRGTDGIRFLETLRVEFPKIQVIIMTAYSDLESTISAYRSGAFEYLSKPFDLDEATIIVKRALVGDIRKSTSSLMDSKEELIGSASVMQEVYRLIGRLSNTTMNVLITGESGTGKELVARAIHRSSPRSDHDLVAINTAAIPSELLETELFGHEKGAFTGAEAQRIGRFEQAQGGTLFLDEIGDMPLALQTRLLRVLSDGSFYRVGGRQQRVADVRVIAATNQNLMVQVNKGKFREDLFHRLNVIEIPLPPLRERREDILELVRAFLDQASIELGTEAKILDPFCEEIFVNADWPGNVRQLENLCRRLTVMAPGRLITKEDLPADFSAYTDKAETPEIDWKMALTKLVTKKLGDGQANLIAQLGPEFERILLQATLDFTDGRKQNAAQRIGWGRNTLTRKLKELFDEPSS